MPTGQLITLGVGTPSSVALLDLTGLSQNPSPSSGNDPFSIVIGPAVNLTGDIIYALPAVSVYFDYYSMLATNIDVSLDGSTFTTVDTSPGGTNRTITLGAVFVRPSQAVTVTLRRVRAKL